MEFIASITRLLSAWLNQNLSMDEPQTVEVKMYDHLLLWNEQLDGYVIGGDGSWTSYFRVPADWIDADLDAKLLAVAQDVYVDMNTYLAKNNENDLARYGLDHIESRVLNSTEATAVEWDKPGRYIVDADGQYTRGDGASR